MVGAGTTGVLVQTHAQGLSLASTYYFRVVAKNEAGGAPGAVRSFTTQPAGGSLVLLDGRAWELVSPPPGGAGATAQITPPSTDGEVIQASENGGAFTFLTIGATEPNPAGNADESQILSVRGSDGGWSSKDIASPHELATGASHGTGQEYRFFSPDLSVGLVEPLGTGATGTEAAGATLLSPAASERTVYLHADRPLSPEPSVAGGFAEAVLESGYKALVTSKPGYANVFPEGMKITGEAPREYPNFEGASSDLRHVIVGSTIPLTLQTPAGKTIEPGEFGLWEWNAGKAPREQLQDVNVLPNGEQSRSAGLGTRNEDNARGAISADGSRIAWSARYQGIMDVFVRDVSREQTVLVDEIEEGAAGYTGRGENEAEFQFASSDGSRVLFTDEAQLTTNSTASFGENYLYECRIVEVEEAGNKVLRCKLTDLTVDPGGHAGVEGIVDVGSEESTTIYFQARGKLTSKPSAFGAEAKAGEPNVYLMHYNGETGKWEEPVFIATLSQRDQPDFVRGGGSVQDLAGKTSMVSPDGRYMAFMSELPLTGYDTRDANSGERDEELFLYDSGSGRLVCVSCNPTGARPVGVVDKAGPFLADPEHVWNGGEGGGEPERWLAASVPSWVNFESTFARYQPRYLSDSGRVFFDSPDVLVPQATNGLMDVYEYEPAGVGSCSVASATFSERSNGCVALVSSGSSGEESAFLDASESGNDVFFLSSAKLVGADAGSALAVYDAHVCTSGSPCGSETSSSLPCTTADACRAAPAPPPSVFGAPGSATFTGAGNVPPVPTPTVAPKHAGRSKQAGRCGKGRVRRHGKCVRVKGKRKGRARKAGHGRAGR